MDTSGETDARFWCSGKHTGLEMDTWLSACEAWGHMSPGMVRSRKEKAQSRGLAPLGLEAPAQGLTLMREWICECGLFAQRLVVTKPRARSKSPLTDLLILEHLEGGDWLASCVQHSAWSSEPFNKWSVNK